MEPKRQKIQLIATLIPKDGTTPGSCDEVDPSVATCSYVPNLWELCAGT